VTAEPRMEDLLASIRKAINEDIGPDAAPAQPSGRTAVSRTQEEPSATASEIQQLREKISRSRAADTAVSRDPAQRAASLAAALRSNTPRRAWRDIEPVVQAQTPPPLATVSPASPRLRSTIVEPDTPSRPLLRPEQAAPPPPPRYVVPERPAASWPPEDRGEPTPPRETAKTARADQSQILSNAPAQSVQSAFSRLAESVVARAVNELSLEELTAELLRPLLKQWLDENLPAMVERLVREEIERVARTGR
jgi:cell pole-organizing protein PopZ